ncbi:excinuclease [Francisellaceae bacterium]|nr:excinuclease [Francisellaceae bacterium]
MKKTNTKKIVLASSCILATALLVGCGANKGLGQYNINDAMKTMPKSVKAQIGDFRFYFAESAPDKKEIIASGIKTSLRTNALGKSATKACNWVFYSALINLKTQAQRMNANAVENIDSNWKNKRTSSTTKYVCASGSLLAGVALVGNAIQE